jgi:hypothetical protein
MTCRNVKISSFSPLQEVLEELQPILNPEPHFGYPTLDTNNFNEKESSM